MLREFAVDVIHPTTKKDTIYSLLANRVARKPKDLIAQWQGDDDREWHDVLAEDMLSRVREVAKGLLGIGVRPGNAVLIYSATCYAWALVDFACAAIGAVSVPVYETDSATQAGEIITSVRPVIAFAGDASHAQTLEQIRQQECGDLRYIFNFQAGGIEAIADFGESVDEARLNTAIDRVGADDMATIVFTSGSTGKPKGAMLSHRNFTHIVFAGYDVLHHMLFDSSRLLLFLPLAHCFARYIQYTAIGSNGVIGYIGSARHLLSDLRSFKPTYLLGVPRVFEKVYNAATQKAGAGIQGRVFAKAFAHFVQWSKDETAGDGHSPFARIAHSFYMRTVGASMRSALGPNLEYLACGGAPMNTDLAHFFNGMDGITFIQGYGMTETAAPCVVNFEKANRVGAVGQPGPGIAIKLAEDDEVLIKGPNVFLGYYQQPDLTAEVLDADGWLHTGDLGSIDDDGYLFITGRKKDIIITAGGKNISPAPLEEVIATCPIVSHAVVVGDGKPFVAALITLDEEMARTWLAQQNLDDAMPFDGIVASDAVKAFVQQYIDQANNSVSRAESVRKFTILDEDFNQQDGTLTASLKVVRPKVLQRYAEVIETVLYAPKNKGKALPATVKLLDMTTETVKQASENVRLVSENVNPKIKEVLDQAKSNVNTVTERMRRQKPDRAEDDGRPDEDAEDVGGGESSPSADA